MYVLSSLVSIPDEELDVLTEEDLALLSRRFERLHENRRNSRRSSGPCYKCGKKGHFIAEYPKADERKVDYMPQPKFEHKYRSKADHYNKYKKKEERRPRKGGEHKKKYKSRVMVAESDVDTSSGYSYSSSSSDDEDHSRHKGKKHVSKNFNGLCCVSYDFCGMAHSFGSKKSGSEDPDSGSEEEVNIDPKHLLKDNAELVALIENRDDMLRRAKKSRKELRAVIDESSDKISELESKLLDATLEISS